MSPSGKTVGEGAMNKVAMASGGHGKVDELKMSGFNDRSEHPTTPVEQGFEVEPQIFEGKAKPGTL